MGLDARVYRSRRNLAFDPDASGARLDSDTGEFYFDDPHLDQQFSSKCIAVHRRIGSTSLIAQLQEQATAVLDSQSVVLAQVLYSGTHAGDWIPLSLIGQLQDELSRLQSMPGSSEIMKKFVQDMNDLVAASKAECNPIVF